MGDTYVSSYPVAAKDPTGEHEVEENPWVKAAASALQGAEKEFAHWASEERERLGKDSGVPYWYTPYRQRELHRKHRARLSAAKLLAYFDYTKYKFADYLGIKELGGKVDESYRIYVGAVLLNPSQTHEGETVAYWNGIYLKKEPDEIPHSSVHEALHAWLNKKHAAGLYRWPTKDQDDVLHWMFPIVMDPNSGALNKLKGFEDLVQNGNLEGAREYWDSTAAPALQNLSGGGAGRPTNDVLKRFREDTGFKGDQLGAKEMRAFYLELSTKPTESRHHWAEAVGK